MYGSASSRSFERTDGTTRVPRRGQARRVDRRRRARVAGDRRRRGAVGSRARPARRVGRRPAWAGVDRFRAWTVAPMPPSSVSWCSALRWSVLPWSRPAVRRWSNACAESARRRPDPTGCRRPIRTRRARTRPARPQSIDARRALRDLRDAARARSRHAAPGGRAREARCRRRRRRLARPRGRLERHALHHAAIAVGLRRTDRRVPRLGGARGNGIGAVEPDRADPLEHAQGVPARARGGRRARGPHRLVAAGERGGARRHRRCARVELGGREAGGRGRWSRCRPLRRRRSRGPGAPRRAATGGRCPGAAVRTGRDRNR